MGDGVSDAVGSVHLYRLVSGLNCRPVLLEGWEIASEPCGRYGSLWLRREVQP